MSVLRILELKRIYRNGNTEVQAFEPGLNLLIGPWNASKTTTLDLIDFCLGDDDNATDRFGPLISEEYDSFILKIAVNGVIHELVRSTNRARRLRITEVDGQPMNAAAFGQWALDELEWPDIDIPKGNSPTATDEMALSFKALYRHIYRRADSWTQFATREQDFYRRAVIAFFLGVADQIYSTRKLHTRLSQLESEILSVQEGRAESQQLLSQLLSQSVLELMQSVPLNSSIDALSGQVEKLIEELQEQRKVLLDSMRSQKEYSSPHRDELLHVEAQITASELQLHDHTVMIDENRELSDVLQGDLLRL